VPTLAILADDLTGAADTGAAFAQAGLATSIVLTGDTPRDLDVIIRSTASRDVDASTAAARNARGTRDLLALPEPDRPRWVYKKIDSALRGHPREEVLAVMAAMGEAKALIAPALPAEARTTVGGRHLIGGSPLEETSLGSPGVTSQLADLFGAGGQVAIHHLDLDTIRAGEAAIAHAMRDVASGLLIVDAETDRDLAAVARAALASDLRLFAGSAGLARQLAYALSASTDTRHPEPQGTVAGPVLVVAGSRHAATAHQVDVLQREGFPVVRTPQSLLEDRHVAPDAVISQLATHLSAGRSVVLTTAGLPPSPLGSELVVARLASIVATPSVREHLGGLVLTGGDVAAGVLAELGACEIRLSGEVRPAMPWGIAVFPDATGIPVATKAGSFGIPDALLACTLQLRRA
jgi:uncharacterized protein YgbK (DUF1537 family)